MLPAKIIKISLKKLKKTVKIKVKNIANAIGKKGKNIKLASKLTG